MTTDELIAKLLDGTISVAERQQLQTLAASSPALAEEIHRLTVIENLLASGEEDKEMAAATPFLRSVEQSIAASIAAGGTVSAGSGSIPRMIFTPLLVLLGGIGIFLAWPSSDEPTTVREQYDTPPSLSMHVPATPEAVVPDGPAAAEPVERPVETRRPVSRSAETPVEREITVPPTAEPTVPEVETTQDGKAFIDNTLNSGSAVSRQLEVLQNSYEASLKQGDNVKAAMTAKSLGSLYRNHGRMQQAQTYLQTSLELSRKARLQEYEAEALGELGLLARDTGNTTAAREYISSCIELLQKSGVTSSLQRWEKELARLNN